MVTVAADDLTGILVHQFCPVFVFVPILPTGRRNDEEDAQFVERIHKRRILRIVGSTDNVHTCILQSFGIAPLLGVGHRVPHEGKILMSIAAYELAVRFAVEPESVLAAEFSLADTALNNSSVTFPP